MSGRIGAAAFPQNIVRPTPLGRGSRESRPTAGLQNHQQDLEKNRRKADKAQETRERNQTTVMTPMGTSSGTVPGTPISKTPVVAAQAQPPLPRGFTPGHPWMNSNSGSPALPRAPFTPIHHLQSFSSPVPSPSARATLITQNFQPTYPDFSQQPTPPVPTDGLAHQQSSAIPQDSIAQFLATLPPEQMSQLMSGMNPFYSGDSYDSSFPGAERAFDNDLDQYSNGVNPLTRQTEDGLGPDDADKPWSAAPGNDGDDQQDDDGNNTQPTQHTGIQPEEHAGAQSLLQVTMQDVNVTRTRKRRRTRGEMHSDDDNDKTGDKGNKTSRKKRRGRQRKSRSIRDVAEDRQQIVKFAYRQIQKSIATSKAWPTAGDSGDPGANDDDFENLIDVAWEDALDALDVDPEECESRTTAERNLIHARVAQLRGAIVAVADSLVPTYYKFVDPQSLENPTPEAREAALATNRELVDGLQATYMFKDPQNPRDDASDVCRHPIFQHIVNKAFFAKTGSNCRSYVFNDFDHLPIETLALIMDAIMCAIDRWKTGEHNVKANPFNGAVYGPIHTDTLRFLAAWQLEYRRPEHPVDLASACLRDLLKNGRDAAGISAEPAPAQKSRFPMHLFVKVAAPAATLAGAPMDDARPNDVSAPGGI